MTTSPTAGAVTVDLRKPDQLLAAIPHLLGFRPERSILVLAHAGDQANRIGHALRADLPPPGREHELAKVLHRPLRQEGTHAVTLAVVGNSPEERAESPPHRGLVDTVRALLSAGGVRTMHALWVPEIREGAAWCCYDEPGCGGTLPDPASTVLAAVAAHAGLVTYGSRQESARRLTPDDPAALRRRAGLLRARAAEFPAASGVALAHGYRLVRDALRRAECGTPSFTDGEVADLACALELPEVRDACLATALPPGTPRAATAERLWLALVRAIPAPERAQAASLLAYSAYVRGDGALAGMAATNAREADPQHMLAGLLEQALHHALPPRRLAQLGQACDGAALWGSDPPGEPGTPPTPGSPPAAG
ncbi:DUF4192 domain-containing protein [Prauserella muralis]|uniref:Uncharacterized protein n=1 Tax=Prauserella muralis TaxID=588067 RepID=A0A2V4AI17_9PSEU|nr:DUF4192 domain-containing protein [Prauserella muralis]PXY19558.1 hypothetical protein BAY60_33050 [Prauserella muralis]TWE29549.1 uncharacterized protein DUF4192 [Prauserella muralis]